MAEIVRPNGDFVSVARPNPSQIGQDSPSYDQVSFDPSKDIDFWPPVREIVVSAEATITYISLAKRQITATFPVGRYAMYIHGIRAGGSTYTQGEILGLW